MPYGEIRIIAGQLRGRKLKVVDLPDLRPTPDRVRERVFNWLTPYLSGARCLDLFAGTGVLGLEAISRGAKETTAIEASTLAITALSTAAQQLGRSESIHIVHAALPEGLSKLSGKFNLVFIDPPYQSNLLLPTIAALNKQNCLLHHAIIYIESSRFISVNELPADWSLLKSAQIGQVVHQLLRFEGNKNE